MDPVVAVVVAAGSGVRLGGDVPKALRTIGGISLVRRSVDALADGGVSWAVVVTPPGMGADFDAVLSGGVLPYTLIDGGAIRQESVGRGLAAVDAECRVVLVHDAARPLVPPEVTARVIAAVRDGAVACVPVTPVVDTIRQVTAGGSQVIDREELRAVQTPQGFDRGVLMVAHERLAASGQSVTDDAAAVEALGFPVTLVEGSRESFKITNPLDLIVAESISRSRE